MKIAVSACLLGYPCRWHGMKLSPSKAVARLLADINHTDIYPVCPELLAGLPTPRPPVKRLKGHVYETCSDKTLRYLVTGRDVTKAYINGAEITLQICLDRRINEAIFCKWSPSCDKTGLAGRLLINANIPVFNYW